MLEARDIGVRYGRREILRRVDFTARPGEITAIVGPNGSGKTTLLRALTGETPYTGQARINGRDIARARPWELAEIRAVLPQAAVLAFPFTVREVVRLGLTRRLEADEALPAAALDRVGLAGFEGRFYQELSGGEQQRVQLARVLVQVWHPVAEAAARWLFLDEPVASLDIAHQLQVMEVAAAYARAGGGVIAVMHDLNLTAMFAANVALMAAGRVVRQGPVATVLDDAALSAAYGCRLRTNTAPEAGIWLLPHVATR